MNLSMAVAYDRNLRFFFLIFLCIHPYPARPAAEKIAAARNPYSAESSPVPSPRFSDISGAACSAFITCVISLAAAIVFDSAASVSIAVGFAEVFGYALVLQLQSPDFAEAFSGTVTSSGPAVSYSLLSFSDPLCHTR